MAHRYKLKEFEVGDIDVSNGVKSKVTNIDPDTGSVSWSIDYIPNIDKLVEDVDELTKTAKGVYQKAKDDKKFLDIYEQARSLRNTIRTHVRNNYPDDYKKAMNEAAQDVKVELPNVTKTKANNQITTVSGFADFLLDAWDAIAEKEQDGIQKNAFIKQARSFLEKAKGEEKKVDETSMSGAAGAYLTPYAFRIPKKKKKKKVSEQGQDPGASLGPGPKATSDGVPNSAYVKQFKYQLVPKNKQGTYVQKGSTMPVRKLWGE